ACGPTGPRCARRCSICSAMRASLRILHTFGDSLKRTTVCNSCTPRRRGRALPAHESRLRLPDICLNGGALASHPPPHALTHPGDPGPRDPPRRVRRAWLRGLGFCLGLGRLTLAWSLRRAPARSPHEAAAEEIQTRAAEHLALQHFQAIDVPLDRAGRPRQ